MTSFLLIVRFDFAAAFLSAAFLEAAIKREEAASLLYKATCAQASGA